MAFTVKLLYMESFCILVTYNAESMAGLKAFQREACSQ